MKNFLILFTIVVLLTSCSGSCGGPQPQNKKLTYQNIVILSDFSSRLDNKPPKDIEEIHRIVQFFKNECVKPGEKIGDKSSLTFSSFSNQMIASIDLEKIKRVGEKQQFVNSTGKYQKNGLMYEIQNFEQKVKSSYAIIRDSGLDLISVLMEKIENEPLVKSNTFFTDGIDTTFVNYDNHIYLFTDGYLEYRQKNVNSQFYYGVPEIDSVRQFCRRTNADPTKALKMNASLRLPPYKSNKNQFITLHVLETHERDKDDKDQRYKYPVGQRDNEILEAVWRNWAEESGFKELKWEKY